MGNLVVTGGSSGIGAALVRHFVNKGWNVVSMSRSDNVDISDPYKVRSVFYNIKRVDLLINNAGIFVQKPFIECSDYEIDEVMTTNVMGAMYVTRHALPLLTPGARIINISSVSALGGIKNQAIYSASKAALTAFGQSLAQEGYQVSTLHIGGVRTPLNPFKESELLEPEEVVKSIQYIIDLPANAVLKELTLFPQSEWHP